VVIFSKPKGMREHKSLGNTGLDHYFHWAAKRWV